MPAPILCVLGAHNCPIFGGTFCFSYTTRHSPTFYTIQLAGEDFQVCSKTLGKSTSDRTGIVVQGLCSHSTTIRIQITILYILCRENATSRTSGGHVHHANTCTCSHGEGGATGDSDDKELKRDL